MPGSKSIANRSLFLAALAQGESLLYNMPSSGDSAAFVECLKTLGVSVKYERGAIIIDGRHMLHGDNATSPPLCMLDCKKAGTAARFMPAMLAPLAGEYIITASEQMLKRPMKPLLDALIALGANIEYLQNVGHLPIKVIGRKMEGGAADISVSESSQYLSALLMSAPLYEKGLVISYSGRADLPYVEITTKMMKSFGVSVTLEGNKFIVEKSFYTAREYYIEPDISAACYFYAAAFLTGGSVIVRGVREDSIQGDLRFLHILRDLGAVLTNKPEGICLTGPAEYYGVDIDLNNCSDQTMTLAVIAVFAKTPTTIRNIGHIRYQESNRISAVCAELKRMGIKCDESVDTLKIYPGAPRPTVIETYEDHRMAMAFSLAGLRAEGVEISNPECSAKTFDGYFSEFERMIKCPK